MDKQSMLAFHHNKQDGGAGWPHAVSMWFSQIFLQYNHNDVDDSDDCGGDCCKNDPSCDDDKEYSGADRDDDHGGARITDDNSDDNGDRDDTRDCGGGSCDYDAHIVNGDCSSNGRQWFTKC